jgi:hypothetical protein
MPFRGGTVHWMPKVMETKMEFGGLGDDQDR